MISDGWTGGIVAIDWSQVVIDQMKLKYSNYDSSLLKFVHGNVVEGGMDAWSDGSFDMVLVKGTFDAILSGTGSVFSIKRLNEVCHRLLKDSHGAMVVVTSGNAESRMVHFENSGNEWWSSIGPHKLFASQNNMGGNQHYIYICRKLGKAR